MQLAAAPGAVPRLPSPVALGEPPGALRAREAAGMRAGLGLLRGRRLAGSQLRPPAPQPRLRAKSGPRP